MSVSLKKGQKINLSKESAALNKRLSKIGVGLGWDCNERNGSSFDLDAWALVITDKGIKPRNLVYYGQTTDPNRTIRHMGDNLTGAGDGDDETIMMELDAMPEEYRAILVGVTIFRGNQKKQSFRDIDNTFIRIYDAASNMEICKYNDQFSNELADSVSMLFGVLSRTADGWNFSAVGQGGKYSSIKDTLNVYKDYTFDDKLAAVTAAATVTQSVTQKNKNSNGGKKTMAVSLSKGGKVSLAKVASDAGISGGLQKLTVGLGWDCNKYDGGADFDLDASAFCCGENGKVNSDDDFVFYNNKVRPGIEHTGDNRTGAGDGDDEQINVDLTAVPADVAEINFTVTIDAAAERNQNFGMVENSYIRIIDQATGTEMIRYDLGEDFSMETAIVVAKLYRNNGEWKFNAIGSGFNDGLAGLCRNFGVEV